MRTIPFTDARANLKRVIDQVVDDVDVTLITRRDAPNAVVMSQEHYDPPAALPGKRSSPGTLYRAGTSGQGKAPQVG
jgi:prevent-host-death family protein